MTEFTTRDLRNVLGCFATGIAVITTRDPEGRPVGVTVNSFTSVSLDPPLIAFCLDRNAFSLPAFESAGHFAVNILSEHQEPISAAFARSGSSSDKFVGLALDSGSNGAPLLPECLSYIECANRGAHDGGDHIIYLGRVTCVHPATERRPLLYYRGRYARIGAPDERAV